MMRYIYGLCFLLGFVGLPAEAKWTVPQNNTQTPPSKASVAKASPTEQKAKAASTAAATPTGDKSRSSVAMAAHNDKPNKPSSGAAPAVSATASVRSASTTLRSSEIAPGLVSGDDHSRPASHLARLTASWAAEGDYYTGHGMSATGVRLHDGLCAVDPNVIPYGSVVEIAGLGKFLAVDTGTAVIQRRAAREGGHTDAERRALVIDIYFESRIDGEKFAASAAKFAQITWWPPMATNALARVARSLFADEDWTKIQSKQL